MSFLAFCCLPYAVWKVGLNCLINIIIKKRKKTRPCTAFSVGDFDKILPTRKGGNHTNKSLPNLTTVNWVHFFSIKGNKDQRLLMHCNITCTCVLSVAHDFIKTSSNYDGFSLWYSKGTMTWPSSMILHMYIMLHSV